MGQFWLVLLWAAWILGSLFVGAVGGATRGVAGFFVWTVAALLFSPPLALLGLIAVLLGALREELEGRVMAADEAPRGPGRFASLAGDDR